MWRNISKVPPQIRLSKSVCPTAQVSCQAINKADYLASYLFISSDTVYTVAFLLKCYSCKGISGYVCKEVLLKVTTVNELFSSTGSHCVHRPHKILKSEKRLTPVFGGLGSGMGKACVVVKGSVQKESTNIILSNASSIKYNP